MNKYFTLLIIAISLNLFGQKIEAESATLAGGATKFNDAARSGGAYVQQQGGNLTFNINTSTDAFYNMYVYGASSGGSKINYFDINGNSTDFTYTATTYSRLKVVSTFKLSKGANVIKILNSWGWINIDYIELEVVDPSTRFNISKTLSNPNATTEAKALYQFLQDNYGSKVISGAMSLNSIAESSQWLDFIKTNTGKEPALMGIDFLQGLKNSTWYDDNKPAQDAIAYYNRNGIPHMMWHWRDPLAGVGGDFYKQSNDKPNGTTFDISKVNDVNSAEYKAMIADIDLVAIEMKKLQDAKVAAIWRPLHEAAGGWFWWGAKTGADCKKLWQVMYDRMVKYHGINNLIWVWTYEPNEDGTWYPGDDYVDMVGRDIYKDGDHTSQVLEFNKLNNLYLGKKMIALSECGSIPDITNIEKDGAYWSWFMPWYGSYTTDAKYNTVDLWKRIMSSTNVITLDEMPNLRTYTSTVTANNDETLTSDNSDFPIINGNSLNVKSNENKLLNVRIYSIQGLQLFEGKIGTNQEVNIGKDLSSGVYIVNINNEKTFKIQK